MALSIAANPDDNRDQNLLQPRLGQMRSELDKYKTRYGVPESVPIRRLEDRVMEHRVRLSRIDEQLAELNDERRRLMQEVTGFEKGITLILGDEIARIRERHAEAWSPSPITGYRVWQLREGALRGARVTWNEPWLSARCSHGGAFDEVPHSDGRCGRLGCGIYASKHPELLVKGFRMAWDGALGLVELSGKVVEHADGYRAKEAKVIGLGLVGGGRWFVTEDPAGITAAFHDPAKALVRWGAVDRSPITPWSAIIEKLSEWEQRSWTLANSAG